MRARHPDVIFLSEAFTRPKMMYRLAKVGFSQSYTYFTWRNTKRELTDYLTELTTTEVKEFFRPHFFVNTPDINPYFLQTSGRPGFLIRAALAATLSGLWGVYSRLRAVRGARRCRAARNISIRKNTRSARATGTRPGNIVAEIAALNRIRRAHPALQSHLGVTFYNAFNDQILLLRQDDAVRRRHDPRSPSASTRTTRRKRDFELPLWEWAARPRLAAWSRI